MKSKILKVLLWTGGSFLAFLAFLIACWNLIPDEALNPEVEKFIAVATPPAPENNAFYSIYGFESSPELDPHEVGKAIVAAQDRLLATEKSLANFSPDKFLGENRVRSPAVANRHCKDAKENCLLVYQQKREEIAKEAASQAVYIDRYRKIRNYPEYTFALSKMSFQSPIARWAFFQRTSDLIDGSIAARIDVPGDRQDALKELKSEITFWARLLRADDSVITQRVAEATLKRKYKLVEEIVNNYPSVVFDFPNELKSITAPLELTSTNMANPMIIEARASVSTFQQISSLNSYLSDTFFHGLPGPPVIAAFKLGGYQSNASANRVYKGYKLLFDHLSKSPKEMLATEAKHDEDMAATLKLNPSALFYNPVGRLSIAASFDNFEYVGWAHSVHNLIGLSRLIELQRQVVEKKLSAIEIPAFLANAGPGLMDPYTETPMKWDSSTKRISFELHNGRHPNYGYVTLETVK